jgi:hypothetical protein
VSANASQTRTVIAAVIFALLGASAFAFAPSREIAVVLNLLLLTVFLFVFEVVGGDVAAVSVMVLQGLASQFGGLPEALVSGMPLAFTASSTSNMAAPTEKPLQPQASGGHVPRRGYAFRHQVAIDAIREYAKLRTGKPFPSPP